MVQSQYQTAHDLVWRSRPKDRYTGRDGKAFVNQKQEIQLSAGTSPQVVGRGRRRNIPNNTSTATKTNSFSAQRERVKTGAQLVDKTWIRVNDPSAGSPTER